MEEMCPLDAWDCGHARQRSRLNLAEVSLFKKYVSKYVTEETYGVHCLACLPRRTPGCHRACCPSLRWPGSRPRQLRGQSHSWWLRCSQEGKCSPGGLWILLEDCDIQEKEGHCQAHRDLLRSINSRRSRFLWLSAPLEDRSLGGLANTWPIINFFWLMFSTSPKFSWWHGLFSYNFFEFIFCYHYWQEIKVYYFLFFYLIIRKFSY